MKKKQDITDKFLNDLTRKISPDKPSSNFTEKVMARINDLPEIEIVTSAPLLSKKMWILIIAAFAVLVTFLVFTDLSGLSGFFNEISFKNTQIATIVESIAISFKQLFASVQIGSISIIIGAAIVFLIIFDRFLKRLKTTNLLIV